ncbi:S8 family serine peptidase, partial [Catenulispora yoronensis]|uniref:S8 family serine peptidase n=1 Tax=Catenulispora yoronensis TaxID=450799 RepID=UPI0031CFA4DE
MDTGVEPIADLSLNLLAGADFSNMSTTASIGDGRIDVDEYGHGTGEASLIAGVKRSNQNGIYGLAPEARILPIKASDGPGAGLVFGITPAINYAITNHATVINLALTSTANDPEIYNAIMRAKSRGIIVVAAVGNDGTSRQYYPAAWPGVVGVGAIDSSGRVWDRSNWGDDVDLVAPGVHILRDDNRGRVGYSDGTSEATAYVSAAAALVRSAHPGWTAGEVVAALEATADKPADMHGAVRDARYGAGILDVLAAVSLERPPGSGGRVEGRG